MLLDSVQFINIFREKTEKIAKYYSSINTAAEIESYSSLFLTSFGKEFQESLNDLIKFITLALLSPGLIKISNQFNDLLTDLVEFLVQNKDKLNIDRDKEDEYNELIGCLKKITSVIIENQNTIEKPNHTFKKKDKNEKNIDDMMIIERIFSYVVLSVYAYMDVFSTSLIQYIITNISVDMIYDYLKNLKINSLKDNLNSSLKFLKFKDKKNLSEIINNILDEFNWVNDKQAFSALIKIRNKIAHRKPIIEVDEIINEFPTYKRNAEAEYNKFVHIFKKDSAKSILQFFNVDFIIDDFRYIFYIKHIANACAKYFCLIDNAVMIYFNQEE